MSMCDRFFLGATIGILSGILIRKLYIRKFRVKKMANPFNNADEIPNFFLSEPLWDDVKHPQYNRFPKELEQNIRDRVNKLQDKYDQYFNGEDLNNDQRNEIFSILSDMSIL